MHVLFVHGVGLGPETFAHPVGALVDRGFSASVHVRRGYGVDRCPPSPDFEEHVHDLALAVDSIDAEVVLFGVSGGATLALAHAVRTGRRIATVVHEPLVGPLALQQDRVVKRSLGELMGSPGPDAAEQLLARLCTPSAWARFSPATWSLVRRRAEVVCTEAPGFADFAPTLDELARVAPWTTWTVGRWSPWWRHEAAQVGVGVGMASRVLSAATHTPQLESPRGCIDVVLRAGAEVRR